MKLAALLLLTAGALFPAGRLDRYVVILEDKPVAARIKSKNELGNAAAVDTRQRILAKQENLRTAFAARGIRIIGANQTLVNAMFIEASRETAREVAKLPGVSYVEQSMPLKLHLGKALDLSQVPAAWSQVNGPQNAGAGVKIAILDTGIDIGHPGLQTDALQYPEGFPKCLADRGDCAYVNRKVIVARSYVSMLVGTDPEFSRPDDLSPRDRVGHGTAVAMIAAGVRNTGPVAEIQGVAPGAWLGNYKVFGSPGVNGSYTTEAALIQAIEDAVADGMNIANISLGAPAVWGPLDKGPTCGEEGNFPCDWRADAIEYASSLGLTVVVSAGNDGEFGLRSDVPAFNSIQTPGTAPSAITVGAITSSHILYQKARVESGSAPANLRDINTRFGDGPLPSAPLTAPLVDVARIGNDGRACAPLGNDTLVGAIALIQRGDCQQVLKINHAYRAGAVGVILYQENAEGIFRLTGLGETPIPTVLVGTRTGTALKDFVGQNPGVRVTLDPALVSVPATDSNFITTWSSRGPSIGENAMKPEMVAVGTDIYTATQRFDPSGDLYDPTGYTAVQGTSFAAPLVAGVAAMVKQRNPGMTPAQIKSAVVNTANDEVWDYTTNDYASLLDIGAGRLDANRAVRANVTAEPAVASYGIWGSSTPAPRAITFRNHGTSAVQLRVSIIRQEGATVNIVPDQQNFTVNPSQGVQIGFRLNGSKPNTGAYEGFIVVDGGSVPLRIPYSYFVGDGVLNNIVPLRGDGFVGDAGNEVQLMFKAIDRFGLPIAGLPVSFRTALGNGVITEESKQTDALGIGYAWARLGDQIGEQEFAVTVGNSPNLVFPFWGRARLKPTISSGGVVNAASVQAGPVAPGSYISIFGRGLSEVTRAYTTPYLPLSINNVSVSFDVPSQNLSAPGRLSFVSDGQVNVQVPWELQGVSTAMMKVSIGDSSSSLVNVQMAPASPAFFEYDDASGRRLLAALDERYAVVAPGNPARKGGVLMLYANGLGAVSNRPQSGEVSPGDPLAQTSAQPSVTVGGRPAQVTFSGLAPGFVGLYQVNVQLAGDTPSGIQPVVLSISGAQSKAANIPVE